MERNGCRYLHCPPLRHGGIPACPIFCEKRVFQMFTSPSIWDTVPHKGFFFWGTGFIKDIFRCFYCYPFKEQEFVSKNAKILLLSKGVPEMDLGLNYFLFPLHGHMDRLVLLCISFCMATWTGWSSFIGQELSVFQWLHLGLLSLSTTLNPFYRLHCTRMHPSI